MARIEKNYRIDCYHAVLGEPKSKRKIGHEVIQRIPLPLSKPHFLGIREIARQPLEVCLHSANQDFIFGEIRKYRNDFLTVANKRSREEKELELEQNESLMESNQFILIPDKNIILFQVKREACTATQLGRYLGLFLENEAVLFNTILRKDTYEKLEKGHQLLRSFEYRIARPDNLDAYRSNNPWSEHALEAFALDDACNTLQCRVGIGKKGVAQRKFMDIIDAVRGIFKLHPEAMLIKTEDGKEINLLKDQIKTNLQIAAGSLGDYRQQLHEGMRDFWFSQKEEIDTMFD